jgi:hypothetical protein
MIAYDWLEELMCSICNPAGVPGLSTGGVRVTAPDVALCLCEDCLGVLDSMAFVDHYERPHAPEALAAIGATEHAPQTKVHVRRAARRSPHQSLSHRSGLVVALKHLAQQWTARAEQIDRMHGRLANKSKAEPAIVVRHRLGFVRQLLAETLRQCATQATELVQPSTRTAVVSDYPKDQPCAVTNE